jgi:hypothetical protein
MEDSYEYNERFPITSVKMEELLSVTESVLHPETNRSQALNEKQFLQIALHWLGSGGHYHSVGDMHCVRW